jgi:hypothetical protein
MNVHLQYFSQVAWFTLNANVNSQNEGCRYSENQKCNYQVYLHDLEIGVCCALRARNSTGLVFLEENNLK